MNHSLNDTGIILVILDRFERQRLPRIIKIKQSLDDGNCLSVLEIEHLSEALNDARILLPYLDRHQEYKPLFAKVIHYYKIVTDKALANEEQPDKSADRN